MSNLLEKKNLNNLESGAFSSQKNRNKAKHQRNESKSMSKQTSRRKINSDSATIEPKKRYCVLERKDSRSLSVGDISHAFIHSRAQQIETELKKHQLSEQELDLLRQDLLVPLDFQALLFQILQQPIEQ